MAPIEILILKENMKGDLGLFAPAVAPGAKVRFIGETGADYTVVFPKECPLEGADTFPLDDGAKVEKAVRPLSSGIKLGEYIFHFKDTSGEKVHLQLTVEQSGTEKLGFAAKTPTNTPSEFAVHTQLYPTSLSEVHFEKNVVNKEVTIFFPNNRIQPLTIHAGDTESTLPVSASELTVSLNDPFVESGGTKTIDIIVESTDDPPTGCLAGFLSALKGLLKG